MVDSTRSKLNLEMDEIRHIKLPPLIFGKNIVMSSRKISPEHEDDIRNFFHTISDESGKIDPQELRMKLRRVGKKLKK